MIVKCCSLKKEGPLDPVGLIGFLKTNNLITPKGELKEAVEIYLGGPFFKGLLNQKETNRYPWTFSTFDEDRDEERIDPKGWMLENYQRNPVVLWAHDSMIPAIGYAEGTKITSNVLGGDVIFNEKEVDPFGYGIGQRVATGSIRSGSVGFLIYKIEIQETESEARLIFRNQELLEFSICNVPANPFALHRSTETVETTTLPPIPDGDDPIEIDKFWTKLIGGKV